MPRRQARRKLELAAQRSLERALKEERLGLAVIARAFVQETSEPGRLLARLEATARSAEASPRIPMGTRRALLDGTALVRNALARELGKPQQLLDPPAGGHVSQAAVVGLAGEGKPITDQLGLSMGADGEDWGLGDAQAAHDERVRTLSAAHEAVVAVLRYGPATDAEIVRRYAGMAGAPYQGEGAIVRRRKELCASGRVCSSGTKRLGQGVWELVEQEALLESRRNP